MVEYDHSKIRTKDWVMGHYPMPAPLPQDNADLVTELRSFHHYRAADRFEAALGELAVLRRMRERVARVNPELLEDPVEGVRLVHRDIGLTLVTDVFWGEDFAISYLARTRHEDMAEETAQKVFQAARTALDAEEFTALALGEMIALQLGKEEYDHPHSLIGPMRENDQPWE